MFADYRKNGKRQNSVGSRFGFLEKKAMPKNWRTAVLLSHAQVPRKWLPQRITWQKSTISHTQTATINISKHCVSYILLERLGMCHVIPKMYRVTDVSPLYLFCRKFNVILKYKNLIPILLQQMKTNYVNLLKIKYKTFILPSISSTWLYLL